MILPSLARDQRGRDQRYVYAHIDGDIVQMDLRGVLHLSKVRQQEI
jgi:hypothetical protein